MNVAHLQQHLCDLARLLDVNNAKAAASDLLAIRTGLEPFADQPLKKFADFLVVVEGYIQRGELPAGLTSKAGGAKAARGRAPTFDVQAVIRRARDLYERAADPATSNAEIDALATELSSLKSKPAVFEVADAVELKLPKSKSIKEAAKAIIERITQLRDGVGRSLLG